METTKTIALEEGNHSALAWRTIAWICGSVKNGNSDGNEACRVARREILNSFKLAKAGKDKFSASPRARLIWECVWTSLLPAITGDDYADVSDVIGGDRCSSSVTGVARDDGNTADLSKLLAGKIISQVKTGSAKNASTKTK